MTYCGFGYAKEYDVERDLREILIIWVAPISRSRTAPDRGNGAPGFAQSIDPRCCCNDLSAARQW